MYSIYSFGHMLSDKSRTGAYAAALNAVVKPDSVVLDLGAGPGVFALLSCQSGAKRVYAVEPDGVIEVARQVARLNGFADRIEFFQNLSNRITLPEKVDVIVSDLHGVLPWHNHHIPSIRDARDRFLKPEGILIPRRDVLWAAVITAPDHYDKLVGPWEDKRYDLDFSTPRSLVINTWRRVTVAPEQLLVEPISWAVIDFAEVESPNIKAEFGWTLVEDGLAHGLAIWYDAEMVEGIGFTNRPGSPELVYGNAFFPFLRPIALQRGDAVKIDFSAQLLDEDYVWSWNTRVTTTDPVEVKAEFRQSTFFSVPLSPAQLQKRELGYVPNLNDEGDISSFILSLFDGKTSIEQMAHQLKRRYPERFPNFNMALARVSRASEEFSR